MKKLLQTKIFIITELVLFAFWAVLPILNKIESLSFWINRICPYKPIVEICGPNSTMNCGMVASCSQIIFNLSDLVLFILIFLYFLIFIINKLAETKR